MTDHTTYPEIKALLDHFKAHRIEIGQVGDYRHHGLIEVSFSIDDVTWTLYVDDEYKDFKEDRPVMCLYLVLFSLEMYQDSDDFLVWCNYWNLDTSDSKWLEYYRDLGGITRDIESKLGSLDPQVNDLDYQLRTGVVDVLASITKADLGD